MTEERSTPLHVACERGLVQVMEQLVLRGADISVRSAEGKRPLDLLNDDALVRRLTAQSQRYSSWVRRRELLLFFLGAGLLGGLPPPAQALAGLPCAARKVFEAEELVKQLVRGI